MLKNSDAQQGVEVDREALVQVVLVSAHVKIQISNTNFRGRGVCFEACSAPLTGSSSSSDSSITLRRFAADIAPTVGISTVRSHVQTATFGGSRGTQKISGYAHSACAVPLMFHRISRRCLSLLPHNSRTRRPGRTTGVD